MSLPPESLFLFPSFPVCDFFVLHRTKENWDVKAGCQCKQGSKHPTDETDEAVGFSVWLEGKCRKCRVGEDGGHIGSKIHSGLKTERGWVLLGESNQTDLLGVSVSEALPLDPTGKENMLCCAEMQSVELKAVRTAARRKSEPPTKKARHSG